MFIEQRTKKENFEKNEFDGLFYLVGPEGKILADSFNVWALGSSVKRGFAGMVKKRKIIFQ